MAVITIIGGKIMKKRFALILVLALVLSMLAGCAAKTEAPAAGGNQAPAAGGNQEPAPAGGEEVTLEFYIWDEEQATAAQEMIDLFHESHSNINVELTVIPWDQYIPKMQTVLANHTGPDICWLNTALGAQYIPAGGLEDLSPLAARDGYSVDHLNANILAGYSFGGDFYAIPKDIDTVIVTYNKELFDNAGVAYPDNAWTWDDFRATAKALTIDGTQYGYTNNNDERVYYSLIMANGGELYNEDHSQSQVNSQVVIDSIQFLHDMEIVDKSTPSGAEYIEMGENTHFMNGMAAMDITGSWNISVYAEALGDKLGIAEMPTGAVGKSSISHGIGYAIPTGCEHVEEAWEFLKFLGSDEAQILQAKDVIPANNNVVDEWAKQLSDYDLSAVVAALEYSPILPLANNNPPAVRAALRANINEIWLGTMDVPSAMAKAEADMNAEIAK